MVILAGIAAIWCIYIGGCAVFFVIHASNMRRISATVKSWLLYLLPLVLGFYVAMLGMSFGEVFWNWWKVSKPVLPMVAVVAVGLITVMITFARLLFPLLAAWLWVYGDDDRMHILNTEEDTDEE